MTAEDDYPATEGRKGKLYGLTIYYHFPTIKGIKAEYSITGGKTVQGELFGKAEGEEKQIRFKNGGKPQTIIGKSSQEGITYLKLTSNLNESLVVGDWKYAKQGSQFRMVLKETETLGTLSVAGEFKDKSIISLTFDVVSTTG